MRQISVRTLGITALIAATGLAMGACTTTGPNAQASAPSARASIDSQVDATLSKLYHQVPGSHELVARAKGVLVFPSVVGGSLIVGAEHGKGALRVDGATAGYYSLTGASIGLQAGAQSQAVVYVFLTQDALDKFRASNGWTAGVDANVAVATLGANGSLDTQTLEKPVISFVLNNVGLAAGASVQGAKITRTAP